MEEYTAQDRSLLNSQRKLLDQFFQKQTISYGYLDQEQSHEVKNLRKFVLLYKIQDQRSLIKIQFYLYQDFYTCRPNNNVSIRCLDLSGKNNNG